MAGPVEGASFDRVLSVAAVARRSQEKSTALLPSTAPSASEEEQSFLAGALVGALKLINGWAVPFH
jgi:hypothetical protein